MNSVCLAFYDYNDRLNLSNKNKFITRTDYLFTAIFTLECIIKIVGMGFIIHKKAYLRDGWNWLDFLVVILGIFNIMPFINSNSNFKSLRVFRVLRPLRSINALPRMRKLVGSLVASLPGLVNVVFFLAFVFILFGIFGVLQFRGSLYNRCREVQQPLFIDDPNRIYWPINWNAEKLCNTDSLCLVEN